MHTLFTVQSSGCIYQIEKPPWTWLFTCFVIFPLEEKLVVIAIVILLGSVLLHQKECLKKIICKQVLS